MFDLSYGVRLPKPKHCPEAIANLLKRCFYERPDKRPDFRSIKSSVVNAYSLLLLNSNSNEKSSNDFNQSQSPQSMLEVENHEMENRYSSLLKENRPSKDENMAQNLNSSADDEYNETIEYLIIEHNDSTAAKEECR